MTVQELLEAISDNPAKRLLELRIKGKRMRCWCCPIANYLSLHGFRGVQVASRVLFDGGECYIPKPIADFMSEFDRGKYPELEETC